MDQSLKRRVILAIVVVSFLSSGALLVRYYLVPPKAEPLTEQERANMAALKVDHYDPDNLPPQGELTDTEYALMLMKLREEADKSNVEPGSALHPAKRP